MRITILEFWLAEMIFFIISAISALVILAFWNAKGDHKLKWLLIELFGAKIWVYGGSGIYLYLVTFSTTNLSLIPALIIINTPMVIVMYRLYKFIKKSK